MVEELKCPICCSILTKEEYIAVASEVICYRYTCALNAGDHYIGYLDDIQSRFEEETTTFIVNNRSHAVTQYNDHLRYDLVITVFDEEGKYEYSKELSFKEPPFDFLHNDLDQSVKRLKTILTFR